MSGNRAPASVNKSHSSATENETAGIQKSVKRYKKPAYTKVPPTKWPL